MLEGKEEKIRGIWYEHMIRSKELELEMEMIRLSLQQISTCRDHICKSCFIYLFIYFLTVFPFVHQEKRKMRQISINTHLCFITRSSSWAEAAVFSFVEKPKAIDAGTDKMYSI